MLGSMHIKGGTILYDIGYGIALNCPIISGVTCYQLRFWLIGVGCVTKPNCDQICGMGTPTYITSLFVVVVGREVLNSFLINHFNLSSTKEWILNSCPTYWQYACISKCNFNNGVWGCNMYTSLNRWLFNSS
jgi:hypothetical protein